MLGYHTPRAALPAEWSRHLTRCVVGRPGRSARVTMASRPSDGSERESEQESEREREAPELIDYGCFLDGPLARLRWLTLAPLFLIDIVLPLPGRTFLPGWSLILIFAAYNTAVEVLARRFPSPTRWSVPWLETFANVPYLDLPVVCVLYFLAHAPADPIYILFLLIAMCAAGGMPARRSMVFTLLCMFTFAVLTPTLPGWTGSTTEARDLIVHVTLLGLLGFGSMILISELREAHAQALKGERQAERLTELEQLRDQFIASVSHDLRTPLTAAQSGLGMLEESTHERLTPDEGHLLSTIRRNIERLRTLIDDLLTFNEARAGALRLDLAPVDLREIVAGTVALTMPLLREKRQTLTQNLPLPLLVNGDHHRLVQLVLNLIVNAQTHTPAGSHISIAGRATDTEITLRFSDNGPGIPATELEAIFQHFHRLRTADAGSGLGLANARMLAELHQGHLWAESSPGQGASFILTLPRLTDAEEENDEPREP